jgi:nucleotidyltransferase/DNA polymerase involved in DNA repair
VNVDASSTLFPATQEEQLLCIGAKIAHEIRQDVLETLHFTCSVGIAGNKLLAKLVHV